MASIQRKFRNLLLESKCTKLHDPVMKLRGSCYIVSINVDLNYLKYESSCKLASHDGRN